jgi:hypothetical protein
MAGILDIHAELAIANLWAQYMADAAVFKALFSNVPDALAQVWFDELSAATLNAAGDHELNVVTHGAQRVAAKGFPMVTVELLDESVAHEPLGGAWEVADFVEQEGAILAQSVRLRLFAKSPEATRALFVVLRAMPFQLKAAFIELGYADISYVRGEALDPEEQLVTEEAGIYGRGMTWSAMAEVQYAPLGVTGSEKPWTLLSDSFTDVDDNPGGVLGYRDE